MLIGGIPEVGWDVPIMLALSAQHGVAAPPPHSRREIEELHAFVDRAFVELAEEEGVTFVPVWNLMCPEYCLVTADNRALYSDHTHLSLFGAQRFLGSALTPRFVTNGIAEQED